MIYTFLSSVFITLFLTVGAIALNAFIQMWLIKNYPLKWACYQHVIVLAIIAAVCFILACCFGALIPDCYGAA